MTAARAAREFALLKRMQRDLRLYEIRYGDLAGLAQLLRREIIERMQRLAKLMRYGVAAALVLAFVLPALAQEHHARGHAFYKNWWNKTGINCCNDQDCGTLAEDNERTVDGRLEIRIEGQWCEVRPNHYLQSGNAPDWSTAHVCVQKAQPGVNKQPCDRLLCYQPKPSF